jgi:hypothetical protein
MFSVITTEAIEVGERKDEFSHRCEPALVFVRKPCPY